MTIQEAISWVDTKKYNIYTREDKIRWLSEQDMALWLFLGNFEEFADKTFRGYGEDTPLDQKLLAPEPFDRLYLRWLEAQIDYANQEYTKYNNAMALHLDAWKDLTAWCFRNYTHKTRELKYF